MSPYHGTRRAHPSGEPCRVCCGNLREAFSGVLLGDVHVTYGICEACGSLILPSPHWLERSYRTVLDPDPDTGAGLRADFVATAVQELRSIGELPRDARTLDYGAGKALLLARLVGMGLDAWGFDPYPNPEHVAGRVSARIPEGSFHLVTCIEVIEHTTDPAATMARLAGSLDPHGILLLSTELFDERQHGPDWWYLTPEHGQHVTILSKDGLTRLVDGAGLRWHSTLPFGGRPFLHVLTHARRELPEGGLARVAVTVRRRERRARISTYVQLLALAVTRPGQLAARIRRRIGGSKAR